MKCLEKKKEDNENSYLPNEEVVKFIEKEFGFKRELVKVDKVSLLDHFRFQVKDYEYQADISEDCGNGNYYYSLIMIDHL